MHWEKIFESMSNKGLVYRKYKELSRLVPNWERSMPGPYILSPYLFNLHAEYINGEGNGTPLQYSCLENPMD